MSFRIDAFGVLRWAPWEEIPWLVHGFTTRAAGDFRTEASADANARAGHPSLRLATVKQTHSDRVWPAERTLDAPERVEADALTLGAAGVLAGVRVADCAPVLLVNRRRRATAAIHAGWRGAARGVAARGVEALLAEHGGVAEEIGALIGPCIGPERFEVGDEVAELFPPEVVARRPEQPRPRLDLAAANRLSLLAAGVPAANIVAAGMCTFSERERFHSHRRDGAAAGRMLAFAGIAEEDHD